MSRSIADDLAAAAKRIMDARAEGPAPEGRAWAAMARLDVVAKDWPKARASLAEAEARVHPAGQATDEAGKRAWLALRGEIAEVHGRLDRANDASGSAADHFEEAARLGREAGDLELRANALLHLATVNAQLGKVLDAAIQAEESEDLFVEAGSRTGDVAARAVADRMAALIVDNEELAAAADEDLETARTSGKDSLGLGWRLRSAAACFIATEEEEGVQDALGLLEEAAAAFRAAESRSGEARAIRTEAACLLQLGSPDDATEALLEAAAIYAEIDAPLPQARAMLEAGHASREADEILQAGDCYAEAAKLFKQHDAPFEEGFSSEALADLRLETGKIKEARELYGRAVKLYEEVGAEVDDQRAACLLSLGIASRETGELDEARRRLAEAGALAGKIGEAGVKAEAEKELKKVEKIIAGKKR